MGVGNVSPQAHTTWSNTVQDSDRTTVVSGETTAAQVAARLGVSVDDLVAENPQIADPNHLSTGTEVRIPPRSRAADEDDSALAGRAGGETYSDAQMLAPLFKAKVSGGNGSTGSAQGYFSNDPRFGALNAALTAGDGASATEAATKLIAELKTETPPDARLLNAAQMGLAAGAMIAGNLDDAKAALLGVQLQHLTGTDKEQFGELRDLLKEAYRSSYTDSFGAHASTVADSKDPGRAAANAAQSMLQLLEKTDPSNTSEIQDARLRKANAQLFGGHYREAEKTLSGVKQKQLAPEQQEYFGALQEELHAQQIQALGNAFHGDIKQARYPQAAENATAIVNDLKKYFPEAKKQLTLARLDQATAQFLNGDLKSARKSLGQISQQDLKSVSTETRARFKELNSRLDEIAKQKSEQVDIQRRLETIKTLVTYGDKDSKNDAVAEAQKLLAEVQAKHPENTQAIENMKLAVAGVTMAAGDPAGAAALAKDVSTHTDDPDTKDQADYIQAQALLDTKPPQMTQAADLLRKTVENGSSEEARKQAKDLLVSIEGDYVNQVANKATDEKKALNDFKKDKWGDGKYDVVFTDAPEEKAAFDKLDGIAEGAKLAASVMKTTGMSLHELQGMDERALLALPGVKSSAQAHLLKQTLEMPDMRRIGRDEFQPKQFSWGKGEWYGADTSLYDTPKDVLAKWVGNRVRSARSVEEEWSHDDSRALRVYGKVAGAVLDGISAANSFVKETIQTARDFYQRQGGFLGKAGQVATFLVDQAASTVTMPATVLDYKASDAERGEAISGTLLMAATAGLLKVGGPALTEPLREGFGLAKAGVVNSRLGQAVANSWVGKVARGFEESSFAKGVDSAGRRASETLGKINRFGRPKIATEGGVPKGGTNALPPGSDAADTLKMPQAGNTGATNPRAGDPAPTHPGTTEPNAADTVRMNRVETHEEIGSADTQEMPAVEIHDGIGSRTVEEVVGEIVGERTAAEIKAGVTDKEMKGVQRGLVKGEYRKLVQEKKHQLFHEKETALGRNLTESEFAELDPEITKQAKKLIQEQYGEGWLRDRLRGTANAKYPEEKVRQLALGERIYENHYHGTIERKPGTTTQAQYEQAALQKGREINDSRWESPDGKSTVTSNGYWQVRESNLPNKRYYGLDPEKVGSGEDIRRFYFNVKPDSAADFANYLTKKLNDAKVDWNFKMPNEIAEFQRPDAGVLYVEKGDYKAVKKIVTEYAEQHPGAFASEVPAFTKEIRPGIAVAEEPLQTAAPGQPALPQTPAGRHSLGSSRSDVMAEAILSAPPNATKAEIVQIVRDRMKHYGLDPDRPWLAKSTNVDDL